MTASIGGYWPSNLSRQSKGLPAMCSVSKGSDRRFTITAETVRAYEATEFSISGPDAQIRVRIGDVAPFTNMALSGVERIAIITAYNPFSQPTSDTENEARQSQLIRSIESLGLAWLPALGSDPSEKWPSEPSIAVLDPPLNLLVHLLVEFDQNAIVILERERPAWLRFHPKVILPENFVYIGQLNAADAINVAVRSAEANLRQRLDTSITQPVNVIANDEFGVILDVGNSDVGSFNESSLFATVPSYAAAAQILNDYAEVAIGLFLTEITKIELGISKGHFVDDGSGTYFTARIVKRIDEDGCSHIEPAAGLSVVWDTDRQNLQDFEPFEDVLWDEIFS